MVRQSVMEALGTVVHYCFQLLFLVCCSVGSWESVIPYRGNTTQYLDVNYGL